VPKRCSIDDKRRNQHLRIETVKCKGIYPPNAPRRAPSEQPFPQSSLLWGDPRARQSRPIGPVFGVCRFALRRGPPILTAPNSSGPAATPRITYGNRLTRS
jgi:hypothetical protein